MHKKVLSEIDLHFGQIQMPNGFEIDREKLGADQVDIFQGDAVSRIAFLDGGYDLVFLDPPYDHDLLPSVLPTCLRLLAPGGLLYTESDQPFVSEPLPEWLAGWQVVRSDRAGAVHFALLSKE